MHSQRPPSQVQNSTTSFLTATTLIYAIGAGITAAAGHLYQVSRLTLLMICVTALVNKTSLRRD
jgi:hypothetical protein